MNHCGIQQIAFSSTRENFRNSDSVSMSDCRNQVVCPKPRRIGRLNSINDHPLRFLRWHLSHQSETCDPKSGSDLVDIILTKGGNGCGADQSNQVVGSSQPPFFCGSPPSRVANPLIQDARFGVEKLSPLSPVTAVAVPPPSDFSSPNSSARKGGCNRPSFGSKPAVRIEGFDCLDGDRRNCGIPALA